METNRQKAVEQSTPAAPDQLPPGAKGLSRKHLYAMGKELRNACPRRSHARWKAARGRPDTVRLVLAAEKGRLADLLPLRQLRDIKISIRVEAFGAAEMNLYATWCGRALALSHARSGSSALLSGYMGKSDAFEQALASFSIAYAEQNEKDHAALKRAIRAGKIKAQYEKET